MGSHYYDSLYDIGKDGNLKEINDSIPRVNSRGQWFVTINGKQHWFKSKAACEKALRDSHENPS